jgi:hypothetical protein
MSQKPNGRRLVAVCGGAALISMGAIVAACGNGGNQAPPAPTTTSTTTATTTSPPPASPTEKSISPTGGNLFSPQVIAPAAPTEPPGVHRHR